MKAKVILGALGIVITSAIAVATAFLTVPRGYDTCEVCGYNGDISECRHCDKRMCWKCWEKVMRGDNRCPKCGLGNP